MSGSSALPDFLNTDLILANSAFQREIIIGLTSNMGMKVPIGGAKAEMPLSAALPDV